VVNRIDPSGMQGDPLDPNRPECYQSIAEGDVRPVGCNLPPKCYEPLPEGDISPLDCPPRPLAPDSRSVHKKLLDTIRGSRLTQEDDGFIFGFGHAKSNVLRLLGINPPGILKIENECWRGSGQASGFEIVYDFKHQERGIFTYKGNLVNYGTLFNTGVASYVGKTRGFANQNYEQGVSSYSGLFVSISENIEFPLIGNFGRVEIDAAPLTDAGMINYEGVFATYYGVAGGFGFGLPLNYDYAVTDYTLWHRESYVPRNSKKSRFYRTVAAIEITNEMTMLSRLYPQFRGPSAEAIGKLWEFVYRP
jgi:hypothetical protein